jgi:hypothetical protein
VLAGEVPSRWDNKMSAAAGQCVPNRKWREIADAAGDEVGGRRSRNGQLL